MLDPPSGVKTVSPQKSASTTLAPAPGDDAAPALERGPQSRVPAHQVRRRAPERARSHDQGAGGVEEAERDTVVAGEVIDQVLGPVDAEHGHQVAHHRARLPE